LTGIPGQPSYWQNIYEAEGRPGWDLGGPTPLLPELLDLAEQSGMPLGPSLAVPGCGFGHDAAELARRGFRVTGVDFAPAALQGARERYGDAVRWVREDWFAGSRTFDGIFDHACFTAMEPERREDYMGACARRLKPGGAWLAAFFHQVARPGGPPYAVSMDEVRSLAEPWFELLRLEPAARSHPRRAGREFLAVGRRRAGVGGFPPSAPATGGGAVYPDHPVQPRLFPFECE
jgi:SAM-dependent methyltransferase